MSDRDAADKRFRDPGIELVREELSVPDGIPLRLYRMRNRTPPALLGPARPPVLLLHGGGGQHDTFCIPRGKSLAEFLWRNGYEPWLLDWRASFVVTDEMGEQVGDKRHLLDLDRAAEQDVTWAIKRIREIRKKGGTRPTVHVIGHCLGAGVLAQAIASGLAEKITALEALHSEAEEARTAPIGRVVLLTLGLFYLPPVDGKLKNTFRVLEDLWRTGTSLIDPRALATEETWPAALRGFYEKFGVSSGAHPRLNIQSNSSHVLCSRLSFMYGAPYLESNLAPEIHGLRHVRFDEGRVEPCVGERIRAIDERTGREVGVGFVREAVLASGSWRRKDAAGRIALSGAVGPLPDGYKLWADDERIATCRGNDAEDLVPELPMQLGAIPLRMYLQGAGNVRRTWAGAFGASAIDRHLIDENARGHFHSLAGVTLITGKENRLWHRRSIGEMYQWLIRRSANGSAEIQMKVISGYGHQDLLWGRKSETDVFPVVLNTGLGGPA